MRLQVAVFCWMARQCNSVGVKSKSMRLCVIKTLLNYLFPLQDLMAFCKTPPFLEGAQLSQLSLDSLTCAETHLDSDNDQIMSQVNAMFSDINENFTMINSSNNVSFIIFIDWFEFQLTMILFRFRSNLLTSTLLRRTFSTWTGSFIWIKRFSSTHWWLSKDQMCECVWISQRWASQTIFSHSWT